MIPVLLGGGTPLLAAPSQRTKLELTRHRVYAKTGTVSLEYAVTGHGYATQMPGIASFENR